MARSLAVFIIAAIVVSSTAANTAAQPGDFSQYGEGSGTTTLEVYRQQQIETQIEGQRQQIETQRQQLDMQRQQIEMQRQQLEMQRQQYQMDLEKQRIESQKKQTEQQGDSVKE